MLKDFVTKELIEIDLYAHDWKDALNKAGQLMLKQDMITEDYIREMIEAIEQYGPYVAIAPHIALAHSAPGPSVKIAGISLSILKEPVKFHHETNDPIKLLFILAAKDGEGHLSFIKDLVNLLSNNEKVNELSSSTSIDEALSIIQQF